MNNQDLLYHYFSNSLTPEQEIIFQNLLETDAEFKAQFEFEKHLKKAIKSHENDRLKSKLQEIESEINLPKLSIFNYRNMAIAASIALLVGWFGYNSLFDTNYNNLYNTNFSAYPNTVYTITRSDDEKSVERKAFVAYETKNYIIAIEMFDAIPESTKNSYVSFYKAQAYLGIENTENAKALFEQIVQENDGFVAESIWYLALIRSEEHTSELQSRENLVCRLLLEKQNREPHTAPALLHTLALLFAHDTPTTDNYTLSLHDALPISESTKNSYVSFYKAQAYLGIENTENAKALFEQIVQENDGFVAESIWYLALI